MDMVPNTIKMKRLIKLYICSYILN